MRPLILSLQAIGPFVDKQTIDFRQLSRGLFLISGETGSGKTSLFDALTYALFMKASGDARSRQRLFMRSHLAPDDLPSYVDFTFSHQGKNYRVKRRPPYTLPNRKTEISATAELELPEGKVITKNNEVNQAIEDILGMGYAQFKQTSLLAQGEFSELLSASSAERAEVFRKLFGTQYVERFQTDLKDQRAAVNQVLEREIHDLRQTWSRLRFHQASGQAVQQDVLAREGYWPGLSTLQDTLTAQQGADTAAASKLATQIRDEEANLDQLKTHYQEGANWLAKKQEWLVLKQEWERREAEALDYDERLAYWETIRKMMMQVTPIAAEAHALREETTNLQTRQDEQRRSIDEEMKPDLEQALKQAETLVAQEEHYKEEARLIQNIKDSLPQYDRLTQLQAQKDTYDQTLTDLTQQLAEGQEKMARQQTALRDLEGQATSLAELQETCFKQQNMISILEAEQVSHQSVQQLISRLRQEDQELTSLCQALQKRLFRLNTEAQCLQQEEQVWLASEAGTLALYLKTGEACPVCGSVDHPHPAKQSAAKWSLEELHAKQQQHSEAQNDYRTDKENYISRQTDFEHSWRELTEQASKVLDFADWQALSQAQKDKTAQTWLAEEQQALDQVSASLKQNLANQKLLEKRLEQSHQAAEALVRERQLVKTLEQTLQDLTADHAAATLAQTEVVSVLKTLQENLIYPSGEAARNCLEAKQKALSDWQAASARAQASVEKWQQTLATAEQDYRDGQSRLSLRLRDWREAERLLQQVLAEFSLADETAFEQVKVSPEDLTAEWNKLTEEKDQLLKLRSDAAAFLKNWDQTAPEPDLAQIETSLAAAQHRLTDLRQEEADLNRRLRNNEELVQELRKLEADNRKTLDLAQAVRELADAANGQLVGGRRRDFESYVQGYYFRQILKRANARLQTMSQNRYYLVMADNPDKRASSGLYMEIFDCQMMTARPLDTLSGGERFFTALSLALGLSDVAQEEQGGLAIETLFVDEGFGSLDQNSLQLAVRTLADLSHQASFLCGIISHVEALKDLVPAQIRVLKNPRGSSVVTDF